MLQYNLGRAAPRLREVSAVTGVHYSQHRAAILLNTSRRFEVAEENRLVLAGREPGGPRALTVGPA